MNVIAPLQQGHGSIFNATRFRNGDYNSPAAGHIDLNAGFAAEVTLAVGNNWASQRDIIVVATGRHLTLDARKILQSFVTHDEARGQRIEEIKALTLRLVLPRLRFENVKNGVYSLR